MQPQLTQDETPRPDCASLLEEVVRILASQLAAKDLTEALSHDTRLFGAEGIGLDSLDAFELVVALEARLGVRLRELELYECRTFGALTALLERRLQSK